VEVVYQIIDWLFFCYMIMLVVRIVSSWFPEFQGQSWLRFIAFYTDPYLDIFRRLIPPIGMLDISPIAAFFALQLLEGVVKSFLS